MAENNVKELNLLDLPTSVLMDIFELLPYDTVAKNRQVCHDFNDIGGKVLNIGFNKVIRRHSVAFKSIKAQIPRRESERRKHYLASHLEVLTTMETRISILTITYCDYIDMKVCCFIPGRILDEINRVLDFISNLNAIFCPDHVLEDLMDITSMAIAHFNEFVLEDIMNRKNKSNYAYNANRLNRSIQLHIKLCNLTQDAANYRNDYSAYREILLPMVIGPCSKKKNTVQEQLAIEDALANLKKKHKKINKMRQRLNELLFADKRRNRQISDMKILTRDSSHKITFMQKRIKKLESKNRELHSTIIRITECDGSEDKLNISGVGSSKTETITSILNEPSSSAAKLNSQLDPELPIVSTLSSIHDNKTNEAIDAVQSSSDESDDLPLIVSCGRKRPKIDDNDGSNQLQKHKKYKM